MPKVVILGGGFCGAAVAKHLEGMEGLDILLIDKKGFFEYTPGLPKTLAKREHLTKLRVKFSNIYKKVGILPNPLESVSPRHVVVGGEEIKFDLLVICPGIKYPLPLDNKENVYTAVEGEGVCALFDKIRSAESVLIVGGGLIGVEAAAQLSELDKKITLVHTKKRLIERNPPKASKAAEAFLDKHGVEIFFGEKIVKNTEGVFETRQGRKVKADVCIWCAGVNPDHSFMRDFPKECFTEEGAIKVDGSLRVVGFENIYAGGDITGIDEEKTAHAATMHAWFISENIKRSLKNKKTVKYREIPAPMIISLGQSNAIFVFKKFVFTGVLAAWFKDLIEKLALLRLKLSFFLV